VTTPKRSRSTAVEHGVDKAEELDPIEIDRRPLRTDEVHGEGLSNVSDDWARGRDIRKEPSPSHASIVPTGARKNDMGAPLEPAAPSASGHPVRKMRVVKAMAATPPRVATHGSGLTKGPERPQQESLTNGVPLVNGRGLTSGWGMMNGTGMTREPGYHRDVGSVNGTDMTRTLSLASSEGMTNGSGLTEAGLVDLAGMTNGSGLTQGKGMTNGCGLVVEPGPCLPLPEVRPQKRRGIRALFGM
jgi:hypothetical protein